MSPFDTIVAPITGADIAAVAVIRLSGPESWEIASGLFFPWPYPVQPRFATHGRFATGDDGLVLPFEEGHSYTGEQSVELNIHGSRASVNALVEVCLNQGARMARPGEFTERAFLNGRIDLTQAEGVRDTIEALTAFQLRQANFLREGALRNEVKEASDQVQSVLAAVEASVDFSEEIGELDRAASVAKLTAAKEHVAKLLSTADAGRILRQGLRIALVGRPNAGKSSLLNALLGYDRAIVTEIPGTTRDFVEEQINLGGIPCVLTDTAGLTESGDKVERIGIEWAQRVIEAAEEVWYLYDATVGWTEHDEILLSTIRRPTLVLQNKIDLSHISHLSRTSRKSHPISALTGEGLEALISSVSARLENGSESVWINDRHQPLLESARDHLENAAKTLSHAFPVDLATVHLQAALADLGQITGETASEDILERIFRDFCIGK